MRRSILYGLLGLTLFACSPEQELGDMRAGKPAYVKRELKELPGWGDDRLAEAVPALRRSCATLLRQPDETAVEPASVGGRVADWRGACEAAAKLGDRVADGDLRRFLERWFTPYEVQLPTREPGLFTGYFEPELAGSMERRTGYEVPIYPRPSDLVLVNLGDWRSALNGERIAGRVRDGRLVPYDSRADIESGAIDKKAKPLLWLADPVDAFFLHIQGSGRVKLSDGRTVRVGYDGHNGHIYYPIGRYLVETGELEREAVSLQTIRAWLNRNPARMQEVMNRNPSYIFFRTVEGDGPIGAQGVALTAGRSLAVDRRFVPLGAPVWLDIDYPDERGAALRRLVVAQDTGGAIKGAVRGDVFWGHGEAAAEKAGPMAAKGRYYVLLPKNLEIASAK